MTWVQSRMRTGYGLCCVFVAGVSVVRVDGYGALEMTGIVVDGAF